jgi:hypothetical protein
MKLLMLQVTSYVVDIMVLPLDYVSHWVGVSHWVTPHSSHSPQPVGHPSHSSITPDSEAPVCRSVYLSVRPSARLPAYRSLAPSALLP